MPVTERISDVTRFRIFCGIATLDSFSISELAILSGAEPKEIDEVVHELVGKGKLSYENDPSSRRIRFSLNGRRPRLSIAQEAAELAESIVSRYNTDNPVPSGNVGQILRH